MPFYTITVCFGEHGGPPSYNLITTPDQKTADLPYRCLQEYPRELTMLERPSAQMWKSKSAGSGQGLEYAVEAINCGSVADLDDRFNSLWGTILLQRFITRSAGVMSDVLPVIPHSDTAVPLSGGKYFIRNKSQPDQYWQFDPNSTYIRFCCSMADATRFQFEAVAMPADTLGRTVMIDSDTVLISAVPKDSGGPLSFSIADSPRCALRLQPGVSRAFSFGVLRSGFGIVGEGLDPSFVRLKEASEPAGVTWELVE